MVNPEELTRAISEIDLTSLHPLVGSGQHYYHEELLSLMPDSDNHEEQASVSEVNSEGIKTPPNCPAPPPPTPDHPGTPEETHLTKDVPDAVLPSLEEKKKKKKKKSSRRNKKPPPTGFEGSFCCHAFTRLQK